MKDAKYVIVEWIPAAGVWMATSDDVPGLVTGASTYELLISKLRVLIPELLKANGHLSSEQILNISVHLIAHREDIISFSGPNSIAALFEREMANNSEPPSRLLN
jgi:hypothetical protein